MKTSVVLIGGLVLAAGGFGAGYALRDTSALEDVGRLEKERSALEHKLRTAELQRAEARKATEEAVESAERDRTKAAQDLAQMQSKLQEMEAKAAQASAATAKKTDANNKGKGGLFQAFSEMMKDPKFVEASKKQQVAMMDLQYGKLFDRFKLSDDEKRDFKNLLAERLGKEMDFGAFMMAGEKDPQKITGAAKELETAKAQIDERIKTFLNHDNDYQIYKNWEETKNERMQLNIVASTFANAGEPLSPDQEDQLVAAMHAVRTQSNDAPDLSKPENLNEVNLSPEMMDKQLKSYDRQAEQVAQKAAAFLTPKQLEALQSAQKSQRSMQEMGLKMMSSGAFKVGEK